MEALLVEIYFVYALSFLFLGLVSFLQPVNVEHVPLSRHLWALGAFGILHGSWESLELWIIAGASQAPQVAVLRLVLSVCSFFFLFEFARRTVIELVGVRYGRPVGWLSLAIYVPVVVAMISLASLADDWSAGLEATSRYLLCFPAAVASGLAVCRLSTDFSIAARLFGLSFVGYALSAGLVTGPVSGFSDWLPTDVEILRTTGVSVHLFRSLFAFCAVFSLSRLVHCWSSASLKRERTSHLEAASLAESLEKRVQSRIKQLAGTTSELVALRHALDSSQNSVATFNLDGEVSYVNPAFAKLWGMRTPASAVGLPVSGLFLDQDHVKAVARALLEGEPWEGEAIGLAQDGRELSLNVSAHSVNSPAGERVGLMASFIDMTESKLTTEALRREQEFASTLVTNAPVIILVLSAEGRIQLVNPYFEQLTGYSSEEIVGKDWFSTFVAAEEREAIRGVLKQVATHELGEGGQNQIVLRSGERREIEWFNTRMESDVDGAYTVLAIGADVTEAKQRELESQRDRNRMRAVLDGISSFVGLYSLDGILLEASSTPLAAAGLKRSDVIGKPYWDTYWWSYSPEVQARVKDALVRAAAGETVHLDLKPRMGEDSFITIDASFEPLFGVEGEITGVVGSGVDISERLRYEAELESNRTQLVEAQRLAQCGSWDLGFGENRLTWSEEIYRIFEVSKDDFEPSYEAFLEFIHPDDRSVVEEVFERSVADRKPYHVTHRLNLSDGRVKWIEERGVTVYDEGGDPIRSVGTAQDITQRKLAEADLRRALCEKEILLHEIHHRVKNNLQVISSLLYFHAKRIKHPEDLAVINDGRDRLKAMILVHELLYQSEDVSQVAFGHYVKQLIEQFSKPSLTVGWPVSVAVEAEEFTLPMDTALPCGMVLCEVVGNALKHAFPDDRIGHVDVRVSLEDEHILLSVSDDGIGLPDEVSLENSESFGWQLIARLCDQIGAILEVDRSAGTTVSFRVPHKELIHV